MHNLQEVDEFGSTKIDTGAEYQCIARNALPMSNVEPKIALHCWALHDEAEVAFSDSEWKGSLFVNSEV